MNSRTRKPAAGRARTSESHYPTPSGSESRQCFAPRSVSDSGLGSVPRRAHSLRKYSMSNPSPFRSQLLVLTPTRKASGSKFETPISAKIQCRTVPLFRLRHRGGVSRSCFVQSAKPSVDPTCAPGRVLDVRLYRYGKRQFASSTRQSLSPRRRRAGCLSVGMSDLLASRLSLAGCRQRLRKRHPPGYCVRRGLHPLAPKRRPDRVGFSAVCSARALRFRRRRSPEARPTAFIPRLPDLPPQSLMAVDFAITCSLVRPGTPRYPVLVHRTAALLRASFRPRLARCPCASLILRHHQAG